MKAKIWILSLSLLLFSCMPPKPRVDLPLRRTLKVPSEYNSIQSAIDAASEGDTVLVAPGYYYETLALKSWVIVKSEGTEEEHLDHTAARRTTVDAGGKLVPVVEGADGAVIDGFTLTGLGKVNHHLPNHPHGVQSRGVSPIIINNIIHHMGSTGIGSHMHNGKVAAPYICNNIVYANHGLGIGSNHDSAATIINNVVYENEELGIGSKNGAHPLIQGNKVYKNAWMGIGTKDGAFPVIRDNEVYDNGTEHITDQSAGIVIGNTHVILVENNKVYENWGVGIGLGENAIALVNRNESYKNGLTGLSLAKTKDVKVTNNKIHHNDKVGIGIQGAAQGEIINNEIYSNMFNAFSPFKTSPALIIKDNVAKDNNLHFSGAAPRRDGLPGPPQDFMQHK